MSDKHQGETPDNEQLDTQPIAAQDSWGQAGAVEISEGDLAQGKRPNVNAESHSEPTPEQIALDTDLADDVTATDAEAKWNEEAERAQRGNRSKTIVLWSSRSLVGLVAAAAAVALGFGAVWAFDEPAPSVTESREFERFTPRSGTQQLVCPAEQVRIGVPGNADARLLAGSADTLLPDTADSESTQIPIEGIEDAELTVVSAPATAETISGAVTSQVGSNDLRGASAEACTAPMWEQWLVGGSTVTGRQSTVLLANPGEQQARVSLEIFGEGEPVTAGAVIEAGTAEVIDLASYSVGNETPAVRLVSEGSAVAAFLQQSTIRTLEPGGVETTASTAAVSGEQVFLGVPVAAGHTHEATEQLADAQSVLRMVAPQGAQVELTFSSGSGDPIETTIDIAANAVTELPLTELGAGTFTISLESDAPVAAGIRFLPTDGDATEDFAWLTPARLIDGELTLELPENARLHVMNAAEEEQSVVIGDDERTLQPGQTVSLDPGEGEIALAGESIRASVTQVSAGLATGYAVQPLPTAASALLIEY